MVHFSDEDVVRHDMVGRIIRAYETTIKINDLPERTGDTVSKGYHSCISTSTMKILHSNKKT